MDSAEAAAKRPRIDNSSLADIEAGYPDLPFERAVNRLIEEAIDTRAEIAEMILDLEGPRPKPNEFRERRNELALSMNGTNLLRVLKLRLRDRGVDL